MTTADRIKLRDQAIAARKEADRLTKALARATDEEFDRLDALQAEAVDLAIELENQFKASR